jgi:outer membrane immunogenic protein
MASAIPDGSPIGIASDGQSAGVAGGCDYQIDKMVVGGEVSYAWMFGSLSDIGVDTDLTVTGRAGYLITPETLLYGHGGWTRVSGTGFDIDGYKAGLGGEFRLPGSQMYLDARWTHAWMNEGDVGAPSALNIASDEFRLGLKIKFGAAEEAKPVKGAKRLTP